METISLTSLGVFQEVFKRYMEHFQEYYMAVLSKPEEFNEYAVAHPGLRDNVQTLQIAFSELPQQLQQRLLQLNINLFISNASDPDLFEFREFVHKNNLRNKLSTLYVRIDDEVDLAREFINQDKWEQYSNLPQRDFKAYEKLLNV